MVSFKNLISEGEQAFLLSEDDVVLAKCIFSDSPAEIVEMTMFSDCKRELLVTLIRAVLNHFDLKGEKLVTVRAGIDRELLCECGFSCEKGESLYSVDLSGYFTETCCKKGKSDSV